MPYIQNERKAQLETITGLSEFLSKLNQVENLEMGDLNYIISKIIIRMFKQHTRYSTANALVGMLECVKQEFYRRAVALYEDKKIKENGDVY